MLLKGIRPQFISVLQNETFFHALFRQKSLSIINQAYEKRFSPL